MTYIFNVDEILDACEHALDTGEWTGPEKEWESDLGATSPEPHIALDPEYREVNAEFVASIPRTVLLAAFQLGYDQRERMFRKSGKYDSALWDMDPDELRWVADGIEISTVRG
jgi:hypothetical protein